MLSEKHTSQFINKFIKFEVIENNIFMQLTFPNSSILGFLNVGLRLQFQVFARSESDFDIFECCHGWNLQFLPVQIKIRLYFQMFSKFIKELRNWDFWSLLDFIIIRLWRQLRLNYQFLRKKNCSYLHNNFVSTCWEYYFQAIVAKCSCGGTDPQTFQKYLETIFL